MHQNNNVDTITSEKEVDPITSEQENEQPDKELLKPEPEVPLFIQYSSEGQKGDLQDEKDKTGE